MKEDDLKRKTEQPSLVRPQKEFTNQHSLRILCNFCDGMQQMTLTQLLEALSPLGGGVINFTQVDHHRINSLMCCFWYLRTIQRLFVAFTL